MNKEYKIFISYSHKDSFYFNILKEGLETHTKHSKRIVWRIWEDSQVLPGELWHEAVQQELRDCDCAIFLISSNFLHSEYIEKQEFSNFIVRQQSEGIFFFPVLLSPCDYTQWQDLSKVQIFLPSGKKYGLPEIEKLSYAHLIKFDVHGHVLPNPFREDYHVDIVKSFESALDKFIEGIGENGRANKNLDTIENVNIPLVFKTYLEKVKNFDSLDASEDDLRELTNFGNQISSLFMSSFEKISNKIMDSEHLKGLYKDVHFEEIAYGNKLGLITENIIELKFKDQKKYHYSERSQIVSALTLSLIRHFDEDKVKWLLKFVRSKEDFVWKKALVGLVVGLIGKDKYIKGYLSQELSQLKSDVEIQFNFMEIDKCLRDPFSRLEFNFFQQDSEILDLIQGSKVQVNPDLFPMEMSASAFANAVKFFDKFEFFDKPQNWFLPFYYNNPVVEEYVKDSYFSFLLFASNSWYLDAFKYAFCLSMKKFPAEVIALVPKILTLEAKNLTQYIENDIVLKLKYPKDEAFLIVRKECEIENYVEELHFFLNNFPNEKLYNIFKDKINFFETEVSELIINEQYRVKKQADIEFENHQYTSASEKFEKYLELFPDDYECRQKLAVSYRLSNNYVKAINLLGSLIAVNKNDVWLYIQMIICYRGQEEIDAAIDFGLKALELFSTDEDLLDSLADLYYYKNDYKVAIDLRMKLYKIRRNNPDNLHSLGWMFFITHDFENAIKAFSNYLEIQTKPSWTAFQNLGHIQICLGNIENGIEFYEQGLILCGEIYNSFIEACYEDYAYIKDYGITEFQYKSIVENAVENHQQWLASNNLN